MLFDDGWYLAQTNDCLTIRQVHCGCLNKIRNIKLIDKQFHVGTK